MTAVDSTPLRRKDFRLDESVPLPRDLGHRVVDEHHFFYSVKKASYIVTTDLGARFVELFREAVPLGEALEQVCSERALSPEATAEALRRLLIQVEKNRFYEHSTPVEDVADHFPILCYLSRFCNLACTHCYMAAGPTISTEDDLRTAEWAEVFSGYRKVISRLDGPLGKITLTGGEPLARKDFFDIAEAARSEGIFLEVFTNGTLIRNEAIAGRLAGIADLVQISLDGATAPVNDAIRGKGTFRRITRALALMAECDVKLRLAVTLMPANAEDFAENLIETVSAVGKDRVEVRIGLANVQGRADGSVRFADSVEGEKVLRSLLEKLYAKGLRRPRNIIPNFRNVSCGFGRSVNIGSEGTVYGCAIEEVPLGNVRSEPFDELAARIWQLGAASEVDNIRGCRSCDLRYFCNGGCRLNNYFRNKDLFITSCTREKREEILRRLVARELDQDPFAPNAARVGSFWLA